MTQIGIGEALWLVLIAILRFGIPIIIAVWAIVTIRRIRINQEVILNRLSEIEKKLNGQ